MRQECLPQHNESAFDTLDELLKTPEGLQLLQERFATTLNANERSRIITRWLEKLLVWRNAESAAGLLSGMFEMKQMEILHPLTENVMKTMSKPYVVEERTYKKRNPAEGLASLRGSKRENPQQAENSIGFYLDHKMVGNGRDKIIQQIAESFPLLYTTRQPEGVMDLLKRWVSQALIIADEGHPSQYSYGDPKRAAAWLHLMIHSPDFHNTMILLLECCYLLGSPNVPPVQLFSKGSRLIDYEGLIRMLGSEKGPEAIRANLRNGFAALLSAVTADQTTGFGRDLLLAELIKSAYDKLVNGGQFESGTLRILNLGSSIVQPTEIARHLSNYGVPLGPALNVDRMPPRELAAHTTAHVFSADNVEHVALQGSALQVVSALRQPEGYTGKFIVADLRFPLTDELIAAMREQGPNCVIAAQSLVPHLHHLERIRVLRQIFEIMKPGSEVILALTGGYIGTPDVVTGVFAVCTKREDGMIAIAPYAVSVADGWATEGRSKLYDTTDIACTAQSVPVGGENKPAYHEERLASDKSYSKSLVNGNRPNAADLRKLRNRILPERMPRVNAGEYRPLEKEGSTWKDFTVAYAMMPNRLFNGYMEYLSTKKERIPDPDKNRLLGLVKILSGESGESEEASIEIVLAWQDFCEDTFNQATMHKSESKVREQLEKHFGDLLSENDLKLLANMIAKKIMSAPKYLVSDLNQAERWYTEYQWLLYQIENQAEGVYGPLKNQSLTFIV